MLIYFILSYLEGRNRGREINNDYSWASVSGDERHGRFGTLAKSAIAGVGMGALANRLRNRDEVVASRRHSGSYLDDEKYSQHGQREGWKGKFLGLGVIATLGYWAGKLLGQRHAADHGSDSLTESSGDSLERVEEGRPPVAPHQPLNPPLGHQRSHSSLSEDSFISGSPSRQRRHTVRDAAVGLGTFAFARNYLKKRRDRKEQRRIEELRGQELQDERMQRATSRRYTGDGYPRSGRHGSLTSGNLTPLPEGAGTLAAGAVGAATASAIDRNHANVPPQGAAGLAPPPPPLHAQSVHNSSGSETYASTGGRNHHRHHVGADAAVAGLAGGAAGLAAGEALARRRERSESRRRSTGTGSMASPPVSVKLNMHSDGRHVTLRRLTEEEAAAERAARNRSRRRRAGSAGSFSGTDAGMGDDRWRRTEARERQEQIDLERQQAQASQAQLNASNPAIQYPPPPPIPPSDPRKAGPESVGSPGTHDGNATETSTNYADNRRRRRAERAAATARERQARGSRGEYT